MSSSESTARGSHWYGYGPRAADLVLDDIEAALEEVSGDG